MYTLYDFGFLEEAFIRVYPAQTAGILVVKEHCRMLVGSKSPQFVNKIQSSFSLASLYRRLQKIHQCPVKSFKRPKRKKSSTSAFPTGRPQFRTNASSAFYCKRLVSPREFPIHVLSLIFPLSNNQVPLRPAHQKHQFPSRTV